MRLGIPAPVSIFHRLEVRSTSRTGAWPCTSARKPSTGRLRYRRTASREPGNPSSATPSSRLRSSSSVARSHERCRDSACTMPTAPYDVSTAIVNRRRLSAMHHRGCASGAMWRSHPCGRTPEPSRDWSHARSAPPCHRRAARPCHSRHGRACHPSTCNSFLGVCPRQCPGHITVHSVPFPILPKNSELLTKTHSNTPWYLLERLSLQSSL